MNIAVIRIHGQVGLNRDVKETLDRLKIRRKYACVVLENPKKEQIGMIEKVRDFVAFGEINKETYEELKKIRGKIKKSEIFSSSSKDGERKIKAFFRLHPQRKGIESKKHFGVGKGVLGNNKDKINELIRRML